MTLDWNLVAQIGVPVGCLFLGAWVTRWFEKRPKLISYYGHVAALKNTLQDGSKTDVFTHSVVLRNAGKRSATNVRLRHAILPSFQIVPAVEYQVVDLPDGAKDILIPTLIPGEQVTINYLYFPPLTYAQVNAGIRSDEGAATAVPMLLQRQYPRWFGVSATLLLVLGCIALVYLLVELFRHILAP